MPPSKIVTDQMLEECLTNLRLKFPTGIIRAWQIKDELLQVHGEHVEESTIRGRFIAMGKPLGGAVVVNEAKVPENAISAQITAIPEAPVKVELPIRVDMPEELKCFIPTEEDVAGYLERDIDKRLQIHYACSKHPITQGPQGSGKTFSHMYYAFKQQLPFMLISCYQDMVLHKFFGDKTLKDGSIVFREGSLVKMCQIPSVILFDEINAIENSKSYDFHALLQNRELFVKDGNDGEGKIYKLHRDCKIGFAQNPRSAKYIGGTVKPSSFLGRCSYITFPDFTKDEIAKIVRKKYPTLDKIKVLEFCDFFFESQAYLKTNGISVDISIRQLESAIEFYLAGMNLEDAINDGMISVLDAISNPQAKEGMFSVARTIFKDLNKDNSSEEIKVEQLKDKLAKHISSQLIKSSTFAVPPTSTPSP